MTSKEEAPQFNFPLTPCYLMKFNKYYYAIGNSPAASIFYRNESSALQGVDLFGPKSDSRSDLANEELLEKSCSKPTQLRILCLACGDPRNILFSLAGLGKSKTGDRIDVMVNDYDVHILARNILLLDSIFDTSGGSAADEAIFAIWFSTGLREQHREYLDQRLRKLIHEVDKPSLGSGIDHWLWHCYEPELLPLLCTVWHKWLDLFCSSQCSDSSSSPEAELLLHWTTTQKMRHDNILARWASKLRGSGVAADGGSSEACCRNLIKKHLVDMHFTKYDFNCDPRIFPGEKKEQWKEELTAHYLTGVFNPWSGEDLPWRVNPTLFWCKDSYDLHYDTNSFEAFPACAPTEGSSLAELCFREFETWLSGAREHSQSVSWTFSCSESQVLCLNFNPSVLGWAASSRGEAHEAHESLLAANTEHGLASQAFRAGGLVRTHGLQGNPHLNACYGVLTEQVAENGRWGVHLFKRAEEVADLWSQAQALPEKPVALKPSNLAQVVSRDDLSQSRFGHEACFDVITTSNVADHIGLSTLLMLSRPLLRPGGALLTTCFKHLVNYSSTSQYLQSCLLGTKAHLWTTLFGFRAMGYESASVTSPACEVAHNDSSRFAWNLNPNRINFAMVWLATARECNLSLALDGPITSTLADFEQLSVNAKRVHNIDGKVAALLTRWGAFSERTRDCERTLLARVLASCAEHKGALCDEIALFSFAVADTTLFRTFCTKNRTPAMHVEVNEFKLVGIWVEETYRASEEGATVFFFFCWRNILEDSNWTAKLCSSDASEGHSERLDVHVKEHSISTEKMKRACALLLAKGERAVPGGSSCVDSDGLDVVDVQGLVTFHLFDESESDIRVRVSVLAEIFGLTFPPSNGCRVRSSGNDSFALNVDVQVPCRPGGTGQTHHVIIERTLVFAVPVEVQGWTYDAGRGLLVLQKAKHAFFSAARRSFGPNRFCPLMAGGRNSGWKDDALNVHSAVQMTAEERIMRLRKDGDPHFRMPMLTEVKDSLMKLMRLPDLLWHLEIKEYGVGKCVGMIIRHGLLLDRQMFTPVLDLSVCWISSENLADINADMKNAMEEPLCPDGRFQYLKMWYEEYALLRNLCSHSRASVDAALLTQHPELRELIKSSKLRAHWRRVLLRPLCPSAAAQEWVHQAARQALQALGVP